MKVQFEIPSRFLKVCFLYLASIGSILGLILFVNAYPIVLVLVLFAFLGGLFLFLLLMFLLAVWCALEEVVDEFWPQKDP